MAKNQRRCSGLEWSSRVALTHVVNATHDTD